MRVASMFAAFTFAAWGCTGGMDAPPEESRRYTGRMDLGDPAGPRFSLTGAAVAVRVESPELYLHLGDVPTLREGLLEANHYELLIDGASAGDLTTQGPDWRHTVQLGPGPHVVELFKRTEPTVGQGQLLGLELPAEGRWLAAPERPDRRIEIIGDSLTTGFGNAGAGPDCPFSAATEDGYRTYGAIAGRALQAEVHIVAWEGRGVVRNYDLSNAGLLPELYDRALPEDPQSRWDFSLWTPHAVVINAGNNDFSSTGLDIPAFEQGYVAMVTQVRQHYPDAFILCAYPSITDDWPQGVRYGTKSRQAMDRVMATLAGAGISRVQTFAFDPAAPLDGIGCAYHPSIRTHEAMAAQLRDVLSQALGW